MSARVSALLDCRVIPFPRRVPDLDPAATLRRVRLAVMAGGGGEALIAKAQGYAAGLLKAGRRSHDVIEASVSFAAQIASGERGPTLDGAA